MINAPRAVPGAKAPSFADRGYIIVHGEIVFEGRTVAELENNSLVRNYYLGTAA